MARFVVPKFIEMEPKIVGPLTFKQFIYIAVAGAICFILYFSLGKSNFFLFIVITMCLMGGAVTLSFLKIGGQPFPTVLKNSFSFLFSSKIYLWKRKTAPPPVVREEKIKLKSMETEASPMPKIAGKSRLKKLSSQIETGVK